MHAASLWPSQLDDFRSVLDLLKYEDRFVIDDFNRLKTPVFTE